MSFKLPLSTGQSLKPNLIIGEANCDDLAENKSSVQSAVSRRVWSYARVHKLMDFYENVEVIHCSALKVPKFAFKYEIEENRFCRNFWGGKL